jgi:hypothetical protein
LTACVMNKIKRAYSFQEEMYVFCVYYVHSCVWKFAAMQHATGTIE